MDELEIDGKKYLSSRRAAKEHKYHIDYIGQLIRAGKVSGRKVGRAWYVEAASLKNYLDQEKGVPQAPAPMPAPMQPAPEVPQPAQETEPEVGGEEVRPIPAEPAPQASSMHLHTAPIVQEKKSEPVLETPHIEHKIYFSAPHVEAPKPTLTYVEDDEPLLPVLNSRANADFVAVPMRRIQEEDTAQDIEEPQVQEDFDKEENEAEEAHYVPHPRARASRSLVLAGIAIVAVVLTAAGSVLLATSIKVQEGQPASVGVTVK